MNEFVLSCCSAIDMTKEYLEKRNIEYICFYNKIGENVLPDDFGDSLPLNEFYERLEKGEKISTCQISTTNYLEYFEKFLKEGRDILHVSVSKGISGAYNSALNASKIALQRFPERKIYVLNSQCASAGCGLLMDKLCDLRDGGKNIDEIYFWAENNKRRVRHCVFSKTLKYYIGGGRISKSEKDILNMIPLLTIDEDGGLVIKNRFYSEEKAMEAMVKDMEQNTADGNEYSEKCYIAQAEAQKEAQYLAKIIENKFLKLKNKIELYNIGETIGSHTGPKTVALFFWIKEREN